MKESSKKIKDITEKLIRFSIVIFILFISTPSNSQNNYVPGYIINIKGDSIKGLIDYRNWDINPIQINFKENEKSEIANYTPILINEFGIKGEKYISAITNTELSSRRLDRIKFDSELNLKKDTMFLQTLIEGEKSLLMHKPASGIVNYYILREGEYELLEYKRYKKKIQSKEAVLELKSYILQLKEYFKECEVVQNKIMTLKYDRKVIEKLFIEYYKGCIEKELAKENGNKRTNINSDSGMTRISFRNEEETSKFEFGILAGISASSVKFQSTGYKYLLEVDFPISLDYAIGWNVDFYLRRNRRKLSVATELFVSRFNFEGKYQNYRDENYYTKIDTKLKYIYTDLNVLGRYRHLLKNGNIYINGGMSYGLVIKRINKITEEIKINTIEELKIKTAIKGAKGNELGGIIGIGGRYKKYSAEFRYELGNGLSNNTSLRAYIHRFYLLVGYQIYSSN